MSHVPVVSPKLLSHSSSSWKKISCDEPKSISYFKLLKYRHKSIIVGSCTQGSWLCVQRLQRVEEITERFTVVVEIIPRFLFIYCIVVVLIRARYSVLLQTFPTSIVHRSSRHLCLSRSFILLRSAILLSSPHNFSKMFKHMGTTPVKFEFLLDCKPSCFFPLLTQTSSVSLLSILIL